MCKDLNSFWMHSSCIGGGGRHAVLYVCCCLIICFSLMDFFQEELAAKVAEQQAAVMAAGLLDKKESEDSSAVIGPSMLEPEPFHAEVKAAVLFFFWTLRFIHVLHMFAEAITLEYTIRLSVLFCLCKIAGDSVGTYCLILLYFILMATPKRLNKYPEFVCRTQWFLESKYYRHFGLTSFVLCMFDRLPKM